MLKPFNLLKQYAEKKSQDATDLLSEDLVLVEQRVEPAKKAAQIICKKLVGCLQSQQGLDTERRMRKLPLLLLSTSMADSLKDFDSNSPIRKVLEMCCFMENTLAMMLAKFELQLEKEVLEPLNKLSEEDLPEILKNKKQFAKLTTDWHSARHRSQASTGPQAKQDGLREEVEEAWRRLESIKDQYSADLYHFATKEDDYANYFIRLLELQADYHKESYNFLEKNISELKENHTDAQLGHSGAKVYGEPLLSHLKDCGKEIAVPIRECVHMLLCYGLREEGLFRLAAAASVVKKLKSSLDGGVVDHGDFSTDPHAVAGALKSYLRELPEPLMTVELYNDWLRAAEEKELTEKLEKLRVVLKKLPAENYNNLRYLVQFLACLTEHQAVNRMSPSNIAIVLGPNLLWPRAEGENSLLDMASASSVQVVTVIEPLIQYSKSLFPEEVDFQLPVPPASPDSKASQVSLSDSIFSITNTFTGHPCLSKSSSSAGPVPTKAGSVNRGVTMPEDPGPEPFSQTPVQDASPDPAPCVPQTQDSSPPEAPQEHSPSSPEHTLKNSVPCKPRRSVLHHNPPSLVREPMVRRYSQAYSKAKPPAPPPLQPGASPTPQPRACPAAQPEASEAQPQLSAKPQVLPPQAPLPEAPLEKKTLSKKGIRAPKFPPPRPPKQQISSSPPWPSNQGQ